MAAFKKGLNVSDEEVARIAENFEKHVPILEKYIENTLARPGMLQIGQISNDLGKPMSESEAYDAMSRLMNNKDIHLAVLDALHIFEQTHRECLSSDETGMFCFKQSMLASMMTAEFFLNLSSEV